MSKKNSVMSTNHCTRTYFWWGCACSPHLLFMFLPNWHFPFIYHPFDGPIMCMVDHSQRLRFYNCQSPDKFPGKPKIVRSQESLKRKPTFTFTFTLRNIYNVNGTALYLESCSPATNNDAIIAVLLQNKEDNLSKLTVKNRSKIDRNKSVPNKW